MKTPAPFRAVFESELKAATARVFTAVPDHDALLAPPAFDDLVDGLARDISDLTAPFLLECFRADPSRRSIAPFSTAEYDGFIDRMAGQGLVRAAVGFPELVSLLDLVIEGWVSRAVRFFRRLAADQGVLAAEWRIRPPATQATVVADSAILVADQAGRRVVYKDRPVRMDAAFTALIEWFNSAGMGEPLSAPRVIDRGEYGWMSFVVQQPTAEPAARRRFWTRAGMLLGLTHATGGGDLHADNVRVDGDQPVVVDAEVLLRPRRALDQEVPSVLATGWLPTPYETERCGVMAGAPVARPPRWVHVGTDAVRRRSLRAPLAAGRDQIARAFAREWPWNAELLCEGFRSACAVIDHKGLPLDVFMGAHPRVLLRSSYIYQQVIDRSLEPEYLRSAAERRRTLSAGVKAVPLTLRASPRAARRAMRAERTAISRLQVPRFSVQATGRVLLWGDQVLGECFAQSPLDRAAAFVSSLDRVSIEAECGSIVASMRGAAEGNVDGPLSIAIRPVGDLASARR